jgi:murein DD-endopeptidase MepM/ murein hydrolase activator NlpD
MRTKDLRLFGGNFVILDHGNGERSYFAHMKQGSVKVKKGDRIAAGQPIGQVGSSGDSAEPHLHYHLLSGQGLDCELIPPLFRDYTLHLGSRAAKVRAGVPDTGDLLESK